MKETFIIALHPSVAKKRSVMSCLSSIFLAVFQLFVLELAAKHRSYVSTKSGSSRDNWYPIGDTIAEMCKASTSQSLIKHPSYSQRETYINPFLHSLKLGRLICQYHNTHKR